MIFTPWLTFLVISGTLWIGYREAPTACLVCVTMIFVLSVLMLLRAIWRGRLAGILLATLCVAASLFGISAGLYAHNAFLSEYWRLELGSSYTNVLPSEPAAAHDDAAVLSFSEGTVLDTSRALGYKTLGTVHCIAPILDATSFGMQDNQQFDGRVEYWAIGTDCCASRGDFRCGDAKDPLARSGIIRGRDPGAVKAASPSGHTQLSKKDAPAPAARPQIDRDLSAASVDGWLPALRAAEATHNLVSADGALLLRWSSDPTRHQNNLWKGALILLIGSAVVHLLASCVFGCLLGRAMTAKHR